MDALKLPALPARRLRFGIFIAFVLLCFLGGGGARDDVASLLYLRPAAILCAAAMLLLPGPVDLRAVRVPLALCLAFALWMAIQLIPLPPGWWMALPGRAPLAEAMAMAGQPQPWRPISIAPDLGLNSLAAMVVPIAALLGFAALDRDQRRLLLPFMLGAALISALIGVAQQTGGEGSPFYLYRITNRDSAVGLFANRNHQAALLALAFPMLAVWAATGIGAFRAKSTTMITAAAFGVFLVPMILVTGSRAGLLFGAVAAAAGWALYVQQGTAHGQIRRPWRAALLGLAAILAAGLIFSFSAMQRAQSLERLVDVDLGGEARLQSLPLLAELSVAMQPWGTGLGTFDPLFRIHEPQALLSPFYLNHAHNDLIELAITGGAPALLLLIAGLAWIVWRAWKALRPWRSREIRIAYGRVGAIMLLLLLGWSLVDYPLRTPALAMLFAIAAGWLGGAAGDPLTGGGARGGSRAERQS